jgi:hypothetical protein
LNNRLHIAVRVQVEERVREGERRGEERRGEGEEGE